MFKKLLNLFRRQQPWEKQFNDSIEKFNNRPIYKKLTIDIISKTSDDEVEQLIFDNINEIIEDVQGIELEQLAILSPAQKALYSTWILEAEVDNGGFNQFYFNSSGIFLNIAVDGFNQFGLTKYAELVEKANQLFTSKKPDLEKYNDGTLESFAESYIEGVFDNLDRDFYNLQKQTSISNFRVAYIRLHPEEFI